MEKNNQFRKYCSVFNEIIQTKKDTARKFRLENEIKFIAPKLPVYKKWVQTQSKNRKCVFLLKIFFQERNCEKRSKSKAHLIRMGTKLLC